MCYFVIGYGVNTIQHRSSACSLGIHLLARKVQAVCRLAEHKVAAVLHLWKWTLGEMPHPPSITVGIR